MKRDGFISEMVAMSVAWAAGAVLAFGASRWGLIQLALLGAKLSGAVAWPWWVVLLPVIVVSIGAIVAELLPLRFLRKLSKHNKTNP
ncbi:MAG: hypothetical protein NTU84_00570 [Verrucomicrobia bacterium]|nr:hypothetical protein [Verrucomicrobiota bacterium]